VSRDWDESEHPRDGEGQFTDKIGGGGWAGKISAQIGERLGGTAPASAPPKKKRIPTGADQKAADRLHILVEDLKGVEGADDPGIGGASARQVVLGLAQQLDWGEMNRKDAAEAMSTLSIRYPGLLGDMVSGAARDIQPEAKKTAAPKKAAPRPVFVPPADGGVVGDPAGTHPADDVGASRLDRLASELEYQGVAGSGFGGSPQEVARGLAADLRAGRRSRADAAAVLSSMVPQFPGVGGEVLGRAAGDMGHGSDGGDWADKVSRDLSRDTSGGKIGGMTTPPAPAPSARAADLLKARRTSSPMVRPTTIAEQMTENDWKSLPDGDRAAIRAELATERDRQFGSKQVKAQAGRALETLDRAEGSAAPAATPASPAMATGPLKVKAKDPHELWGHRITDANGNHIGYIKKATHEHHQMASSGNISVGTTRSTNWEVRDLRGKKIGYGSSTRARALEDAAGQLPVAAPTPTPASDIGRPPTGAVVPGGTVQHDGQEWDVVRVTLPMPDGTRIAVLNQGGGKNGSTTVRISIDGDILPVAAKEAPAPKSAAPAAARVTGVKVTPKNVAVGDRIPDAGGTMRTVARIEKAPGSSGRYNFYGEDGQQIASVYTAGKIEHIMGTGDRTPTTPAKKTTPAAPKPTAPAGGDAPRVSPKDVKPGDEVLSDDGGYVQVARVEVGKAGPYTKKYDFYGQDGKLIASRSGPAKIPRRAGSAEEKADSGGGDGGEATPPPATPPKDLTDSELAKIERRKKTDLRDSIRPGSGAERRRVNQETMERNRESATRNAAEVDAETQTVLDRAGAQVTDPFLRTMVGLADAQASNKLVSKRQVAQNLRELADREGTTPADAAGLRRVADMYSPTPAAPTPPAAPAPKKTRGKKAEISVDDMEISETGRPNGQGGTNRSLTIGGTYAGMLITRRDGYAELERGNRRIQLGKTDDPVGAAKRAAAAEINANAARTALRRAGYSASAERTTRVRGWSEIDPGYSVRASTETGRVSVFHEGKRSTTPEQSAQELERYAQALRDAGFTVSESRDDNGLLKALSAGPGGTGGAKTPPTPAAPVASAGARPAGRDLYNAQLADVARETIDNQENDAVRDDDPGKVDPELPELVEKMEDATRRGDTRAADRAADQLRSRLIDSGFADGQGLPEIPRHSDPASHVAYLRGVKTRQEARDYLARYRGKELDAIRAAAGLQPQTGSVADTREQIVEMLVGARLTSDAIRTTMTGPSPEQLEASIPPEIRNAGRVELTAMLENPAIGVGYKNMIHFELERRKRTGDWVGQLEGRIARGMPRR
jgi:hypothetical protein